MMRRVPLFVRELVAAFQRNQTLDLAAQVAYFAVLALFPFAMFVLTVIGYIPLHGLDREIIDAVYRVVPPGVGRLFEATLREIMGKQRGWLLMSALFFALWTASGGVHIVTTALNRAYEVAETRPLWRVKLLAFGVTLAGAVATIVATTAMLVGPELVRRAWSYFGFGGAFDRLWAWLRWPMATLALTSLVAFMYYVLPNAHDRRRLVMPGSIVAVLAWIATSFGLRQYVGHFAGYARAYGALGTVVLLLVWLYLWGVTIIVGGEINAVLARRPRRARYHRKRPTGADPTLAPGAGPPAQSPG
jgi:membrane protein